MTTAISSNLLASLDYSTARATLAAPAATASEPATSAQTDSESSSTATKTGSSQNSSNDPALQREIARYQSTDARVRAHEAAHLAAAQGLAIGAASFGYETGPDGKRYAVSGDVSIDTSEGRTPEETLARAQQIRRAALAPADPSAQDRAVAAMASQMAAEASLELSRAQAARYTQQASNPSRPQIDVSA